MKMIGKKMKMIGRETRIVNYKNGFLIYNGIK